jgi:hypothetical protein
VIDSRCTLKWGSNIGGAWLARELRNSDLSETREANSPRAWWETEARFQVEAAEKSGSGWRCVLFTRCLFVRRIISCCTLPGRGWRPSALICLTWVLISAISTSSLCRLINKYQRLTWAWCARELKERSREIERKCRSNKCHFICHAPLDGHLSNKCVQEFHSSGLGRQRLTVATLHINTCLQFALSVCVRFKRDPGKNVNTFWFDGACPLSEINPCSRLNGLNGSLVQVLKDKMQFLKTYFELASN